MSGAQAFVGEGRGHAHIHDGHVGGVGPDRVQQLLAPSLPGRRCGSRCRTAAAPRLAEQYRVVGEGDPHRSCRGGTGHGEQRHGVVVGTTLMTLTGSARPFALVSPWVTWLASSIAPARCTTSVWSGSPPDRPGCTAGRRGSGHLLGLHPPPSPPRPHRGPCRRRGASRVPRRLGGRPGQELDGGDDQLRGKSDPTRPRRPWSRSVRLPGRRHVTVHISNAVVAGLPLRRLLAGQRRVATDVGGEEDLMPEGAPPGTPQRRSPVDRPATGVPLGG